MKLAFNEGIVEAWFDIDEEIFDTLEFSNEDDKVNSINSLKKKINKTFFEDISRDRVKEHDVLSQMFEVMSLYY